eukprot:jgi/Tetstr1/463223/TSEL_008154.t1
MDIDDTAGSDMGMAQSPLRSPFSKDRADGDEERAERGLALADGDAFWKGEPTGLLSSLNGSNKDETGGEEEREPRLQGIVEGGAKEGPPLLHYVTCVRLSSAEDAEVKVGGPLTHARLCAFNNTYREAVQGMNVYTCLEDAEDSTDESYEARVVCHWGKEQLVAAQYRFAAGNRFQHPPT